MNKLIIFLTSVFLTSKLYGQELIKKDSLNRALLKSYDNFITEYKRVLFISPDSVYKAMRFIDPSGFVYFQLGFIDSTELQSSVYFDIKKRQEIFPKGEIRSYKLINGIDTIYSYRPTKKQYNAAPDTLVLKNIYYYPWDLKEDIRFSYLLKQFGQSKIPELADTIIRVLGQKDESNLNISRSYRLIEIRFNNKTGKLLKISGESSSTNGLLISKTDSIMLIEKDIKIIRNKLNKIQRKNIECIRPFNPWLMECKMGNSYFQFIATHYCLIDDKELLQSASLYFFLDSLTNKYFH